jgi:transposase
MSKTTCMPGRPKAPLALTDEERRDLERYVRARTVSQALARRARIILLCAEGRMSREVARTVGVSEQMVCLWRKRFLQDRVAGLADTPRPNIDRKTSDEAVEQVMRLTLETKPPGETHWSTRSMAKRVGLSQSTVSRIWRAFRVQPHRRESFSLSTDDFFVEKVRDVVGLYMNPPDHAVVLCVDEKSQIQALERRQPVLPMVLGQPERAMPTYFRHGTTTLFAALDVATGHVIAECHRKHRAKEFRAFLTTIDERVPKELDVHLIVVNYSTHNTDEIKRWLRRHPRFHLHFTPTYSSWLNLVERWFAMLTERALKRGVHRSTLALENAIREFIDAHNVEPKPFVWTKSADAILASVSRFCAKTLNEQGIA